MSAGKSAAKRAIDKLVTECIKQEDKCAKLQTEITCVGILIFVFHMLSWLDKRCSCIV